ncbi:MAG: 3-oxo-tetronate kinase [Bryobacteraceae bacterium]
MILAGDQVILAAIADDFTGGTDLAGMLHAAGARTVLVFGDGAVPPGYDATVVCLKSRSVAPGEAVRMSMDALTRLRAHDPRQIYFKYCSTFDSTPKGNIGPVTDALLNELGQPFTVAVPALPVNGRTQYQGHLFVNGVPLHESPMRSHPLNPMTDANLVRWLARQTPSRVGLLRLPAVVGDLTAEVLRLQLDGIEIALADAITGDDLEALANAFADLPLLTGGSGLGITLPGVWKKRGWLTTNEPTEVTQNGGAALILAGSCSAATLGQLQGLGGHQASIDAAALLNDADAETRRVLKAARRQIRAQGHAIIRSSATAEEREATGLDARIVAEELETLFGVIAATLADEITRLIVAGGETSGAVTAALGVEAAEITHSIDPGVPAIRPVGGPPLTLVLKSGNFGSSDFFRKALDNT